MKNNYQGEEIDLIEILHKIWNCKFKIILSTLITIIAVYLYYGKVTPTFKATTDIKPISTFEEFNYEAYNIYINQNNHEQNNAETLQNQKTDINLKTLNFNKIDKQYLMSLFVDKIEEGKIIADAIKKSDLIDRKNYSNEKEYEDAIIKFISSIVIIPSIKESNKEFSGNLKIVANIKDKKKWNKLLESINKLINESVQIYLIDNLQNKILIQKNIIEFMINDIDQKISNALDNYESVIKAKLAFLEEQAQIARALEIRKNNLIEAQSFSTDTGIIASLKTQIPYYTRGYEMIEKEIELIKNRTITDRKLFTPEIILLQKEKNDINIYLSKKIRRIENLIKKSPIMGNNNFNAGNINYLTTKYKSNQSPLSKVLILSALIGFVLSTLYFLLEGAIKKRK